MISAPSSSISIAGRVAVIAAALSTLSVLTSQARTLEVGPGKAFAKPSDAIRAASDGDRIVVASGTYADCAVVTANDIVIEGQDGETAAFDGVACQSKAALVIASANVSIRNITFSNIRVPDENGAGVRAEGENLTLDRVRFVGNENGLLAGSNPASTIIVRDSAFVGNGRCGRECAHGIYVGHIRRLLVERSTFRETHSGHHIKSRAARTEILQSDIADGQTGNSSYLIDLPNGGDLVVAGSTLEKGPRSENLTAAIMIGAEGATNATSEITISGNTFHNDGRYPTYLVDNRTDTGAMISATHIIGNAKPLSGRGTVRAQ